MTKITVNVSAITEVQGGFQGMNPEFIFSLTSVPQTYLRNRRAGVFAGKVLGGTSAINAMMAIRGTAEDYDRWGRFFGPNSTWSWEGMLPYFKKAISFIPPGREVALASNITYDQRLWGNTSRVFASWPSYQYPSTKAIVDAFRAVPGVEFPRDGGEGRTGVYWYPQFSHPQTVTRSFSRTGHWDEVDRENYEVILNSKVTRVLFDGTRAVGVAFVQSEGGAGPATTVNARKEVILSAGAIHSPHILQLSGVGPRRLLESAKIPVVAHVPGVGQNFQDHPTPSASFDRETQTLLIFISIPCNYLKTNKTNPSQLKCATSPSAPSVKTLPATPASEPGPTTSGPPADRAPAPSPPATWQPGCRCP